MKKLIVVILSFLSLSIYAQEEDAWVYFKDKPNAQFYLDNPLQMITQRALDRRQTQNIALQINDTPIHQVYIDALLNHEGITVKAKSKWLNCVHVRGTQIIINSLLQYEFVDAIKFANSSLNSSGRTASKTILNPVNKVLDVQSTFNYGNSLNQIQMLNGQVLHQQGFTGTGKIIAVMDSGFINVNSTQPFQRLVDNNLILGGFNYVNQSTNVYSLHNHGTLTLSCMGGFVEGQLVGTAPDASYYLFVTEDVSEENPVEESYWVEASEEADRLGVDVISTSLGYYGYDNPNYSHDYSDFTGNKAFASRGANIAFSKGMIIVASAGNSGNAAFPLNRVGVPAEATNVLAVGAVNATGVVTSFSSIGPTFDNRMKPDVMAQGQASVVANTQGTIQTASGTSFSCPIMAGLLTCFWQAYPNLTNIQLIDFYKQSCDRYFNPDNQYGYGIPNFQQALNIAALTVNQFSNNMVVLSPNPVISSLSISISNEFSSSNIIIYNALGQKVVSENLNSSASTLSLDILQSGIYYYTIVIDQKNYTGKIIKN